MSEKNKEDALLGIHAELKKLNKNIETIISKADSAQINDSAKEALESKRILSQSDKYIVIAGLIFIMGVVIFGQFSS